MKSRRPPEESHCEAANPRFVGVDVPGNGIDLAERCTYCGAILRAGKIIGQWDDVNGKADLR
jgi:hypothetical protein